jgi:type I restriction enzyme S subunit
METVLEDQSNVQGGFTIPTGFKRTEVGIIPEDWKTETIGALAIIKTGTRNTQDRVHDGLYPFFVRSQTVERINSYAFDGEAVLTAGDGVGTGKIFHYLKGRFDYHQRVYRISDFDSRLNGKYFYFYFSTHFYDRISSMTAKSSVDSVRMDMIADMTIPLPPEREQRAIAETLSHVDGLVSTLDMLIAKKRAIKLATMQQLLTGKTRLQGFRGEWIAKQIWELAEIDPDNLVASTDPNFAFNYISLEDVNKGTLMGYSEELFATSPSRARRILRHGDVLMSTVRPNLQSHLLYTEQVRNAVCSTGFAVLRCRPRVALPAYIYYALFGAEVICQIERILAGSNYPGINSRDVKLLEVRCPPTTEEQIAIAAILLDMDAEIAVLERRKGKTKAIKQGMIQDLLSGRIRLVRPE